MFQVLLTNQTVRLLRICAAGLIVALLALALACGGDDDDSSPTPSDEATPEDTGATATRTPEGSPVTTPGGTGGLPVECTEGDAQRGLISHLDYAAGDGIFSQGEEVEMTQTIVNCGDANTVLHYLTTKRYEVTIENADSAVVVWRSSDGKSFDETPGEEIIAPGETRLYTEKWDQKDSNGDQVEAGNYKVSFFNVGCGVESQTACEFGSVKLLIIE